MWLWDLPCHCLGASHCQEKAASQAQINSPNYPNSSKFYKMTFRSCSAGIPTYSDCCTGTHRMVSSFSWQLAFSYQPCLGLDNATDGQEDQHPMHLASLRESRHSIRLRSYILCQEQARKQRILTFKKSSLLCSTSGLVWHARIARVTGAKHIQKQKALDGARTELDGRNYC